MQVRMEEGRPNMPRLLPRLSTPQLRRTKGARLTPGIQRKIQKRRASRLFRTFSGQHEERNPERKGREVQERHSVRFHCDVCGGEEENNNRKSRRPYVLASKDTKSTALPMNCPFSWFIIHIFYH